MRTILNLLCIGAGILALPASSFAQRQAAAGPGITPLSATGSLNGVDMTASAGTGTLTVGVVGGPRTDVFSSNVALASPFQAISSDASSTSNVTFNSSSSVFGAIGITQPGGPFFLAIAGGNAGTAVNFLGPVFATTTNVTGTGSLNFLSGSINITATNFAADGTITLAPGTTLIGALTTTAGANTGTLSMGGGSALTGAVGGAIGIKSINVTGNGVAASISGATNAFAFSLGNNTLNVGGALTIANLAPSGVINTTLTSASVFGNVRPVGATNLGPTLLVNATIAPGALIPVGTIFNIVQTQTGTVQSGTNGTIITVLSSNPLYSFAPVPPAGTVAGLVAIQVTGVPAQVVLNPPPVVVLPPTAPLAVAVVPALLATNSSALIAVNALTDPIAVTGALAQLAPSAPGRAAPLVAFEGTQLFRDLWLSRLDDTLCGQVRQPRQGEEVCPQNKLASGWWLKGFGSFGNQGARDAFVGYNSSIVGAMMAYDAAVGPDTRLGVGVGYARSAVTGKTYDAKTDFSTYRATAYVAHEPGPWFIYGDASLGYNAYTGNRHVSFAGFDRSAQADYSGWEYTVSATTGYHFFARGFTLTPLASLQYTHLNLAGYSETGGGDINLTVQSRSLDFLQSALGLTVAHPFGVSSGAIVPEMHVKWLRMLANPTMQDTAAFTAASATPFTTPGFKTSNDTFNIGAGFTFLSCGCAAKTWSMEGVYDYYWRSDDYAAHKVMVKFTSRF